MRPPVSMGGKVHGSGPVTGDTRVDVAQPPLDLLLELLGVRCGLLRVTIS